MSNMSSRLTALEAALTAKVNPPKPYRVFLELDRRVKEGFRPDGSPCDVLYGTPRADALPVFDSREDAERADVKPVSGARCVVLSYWGPLKSERANVGDAP
mgnify:CR=1 FL=1